MAKHTPSGDSSFQRSLVKHTSAAVALVALVSAAFWGVGQVRTPDTDVAVDQASEGTGEPARTTEDPSDLDTLLAEGSETPDATATDTASPTGSEPTSDASSEPEPAATATPHVDPSPEPSATATTATSQDFAPEDISVQVLDAVLTDGGEASQRIFDELKADGYRAVARNQAVRTYDVTTVMYSPGGEAKARQIAAQYGYTKVEPQPGNLSNSVDVHLVVGADA